MGHISGLTLPTREIELPGGDQTITVRGLGATDLTVLTEAHLPKIVAVYTAVQKDVLAGMTPDMLQATIKTVLNLAPEVAAHAILIANDDPNPEEGMGKVMKLPAPVLVNALFALFELTLHSEAEVKKLLEAILDAMGSTTSFIEGIRIPTSGSGSGESADT